MNNQLQVVSLAQAKKLTTLGINCQSIFYYGWDGQKNKSRHKIFRLLFKPVNFAGLYLETYSAFSVAELGVMLPNNHFAIRTTIDGATGWEYFISGSLMPMNDVKTEAGCRANILIHLLESKLITATEINNNFKKY